MLFKDVNEQEFKILWETSTIESIASQYGVHKRTISHWSRRFGLNDKLRVGLDIPAIAFPGNAGDDYDQAIKIKKDRVCIVGDVETPDHSIAGLEMAVAASRKFSLKTLILNGDFVALDSFSAWAKQQVNKVFFKQELETTLITLQVFLQTFDEIYWISGNHERRMPHMVDGQMSIGMFLNQLAGVEFSEYDHCELTSGAREWLVVHQKNFSIVPLSVPAKLAIARQRSIWAAHNHRLAWGYDPSGLHCLVEGGHLRDEIKTHYKQLRTTTHPMWNAGFGMCIDGMPYLIDKNNFDFWMSIQPPQIESELKKNSVKPKRNRTKAA